MDDALVYLPAPSGDFVELAKSQKGRLFRKQILPMNGEFTHPANPKKKIKVTKEMAASLAANFESGVCDIVQVPVVDKGNAHTEDPNANIGEVIDVNYDDTGVYVTIDARDKGAADKLGSTLLGASAMMHLDYLDTHTGKHVGPTLLHTAITNRPHITNLSGFEEIIAASADTGGESPDLYTLSSQEPEMPEQTLDDLKTALKAEHDIDLDALIAASAGGTEEEDEDKSDDIVVALSNVLASAGATATGGKGEPSIQDVAAAVIEIAEQRVALSAQVTTLQKEADDLKLSNATVEVEKLVSEGKILPKQKEAMLELSMTNREMFERLLPNDAIVALSAVGVDTHDEPANDKFAAEVERLSAIAQSK